MKKIVPFLIISIVVFNFNAQTISPSDSFINSSSNEEQKPTNFSTYSGCEKSTIITGYLVNSCDSGSTVLTATGGCDYSWSLDSLNTNVISTADTLFTGSLNNNTTYYLTTSETDAFDPLPLPSHSTTYSGNVRGYYFESPTDFIISGLRVPTDADAGPQNIAIVKFTNGAPPIYSATTNDFIELGYWANYNLSDTINVCLPIDSGDIIGIYGNRNDINSYGAAPFTSSINGIPVTLTRSGMQNNLSITSMQDIFSETGTNISRVEMFYDNIIETNTSIVEVIVPQSYLINDSLISCQGDSINFNGIFYGTNSTITDSLISSYNCDSIIVTSLIFNDCTGFLNNELNKFKIYPNPFTNSFNLALTGEFKNLVIYNSIGEVIVKENIFNLKEININTPTFANGVYLVTLSNDKKVESIKVIKK